MIFTLLCIKEFVKNFPFVNKNNPTNKALKEDTIKDTKKDPTEAQIEGLKEDTIEDTTKGV